ncbi:TRAP transporter substrate-binding protein [Methylovirgula sp. 4M-Z18]|uniref:TRAP transporter substrate-binding protein n=1 Tax=Methylovirgula sp. 4M-Z18 TaxID=2293567 RepID=UPI001FE1BEDA|nr:TRAP transporter substrate-binding protein DctP [Methylovirgula sp. 4M-Z18]
MALLRRRFLQTASIGLAASALAAPALAQSAPEIKWKLTSSFPKTLDLMFGGAQEFAQRVAEATGDKFQIEVSAPGELAPAVQALDVVTNGTVDMCHTSLAYFSGKDPTFALATGIPFGMNARQQDAWASFGGGNELFNEFLADYNAIALPGGNSGARMGGWFRKELKAQEDLNGLKMRVGGFAAKILQGFGVQPQPVAGADIYDALEKGTIDAASWVGPYDDEKAGFNKVAPFYYYPGWAEGSAMLHFCIDAKKWAGLPKSYQAILTAAAAETNSRMLARYDAANPAALKRIIASGAQLRPLSQDFLEACWKAAQDLYDQTAQSNDKFKKVYESYTQFRGDEYLWWQVAEYTFDNYMIRQRAKT